MRYQDFDELEFTRYDDEEELRLCAEKFERRDEEERKRKKARQQAMLAEHRRRRDDEPQWSDDGESSAETPRDPEEQERIRKRNKLVARVFQNAGLVCLGALLGVMAASASVYARDR